MLDFFRKKGYLLRIEGVNQEHVLEDTAQFSVRRGGSLYLREAIKDIENKYATLHRLSTGASVGLFELRERAKKAKKLVREIQSDLNGSDAYQHFTFVIDLEECPYKGDFSRTREAVIARNRIQQMRQVSLAPPQMNKEERMAPCGHDGLRPADSGEKIGDDAVSSSVWKRYEYGKDKKQQFFVEELGNEIESAHNRKLSDTAFAVDFEQIAGDESQAYGNLGNKLAVLYFDGNDFGKKQARLTSPDAQRRFDDTIKQSRRVFLAEFFRSHLDERDFYHLEQKKNESKQDYRSRLEEFFKQPSCIPGSSGANDLRFRLEVLLWGGDEVMLVVPAWKGLEVLHEFYWSMKDRKFDGDELTHAGALVLCHYKTPIDRMQFLARELAERVKEKSRDKNLYEYIVLESIDCPAEPLARYWEARYGAHFPERRPLSHVADWVAEAANMRACLDHSELPKGKIFEAVRLLTAPGLVLDPEKRLAEFDKALTQIRRQKDKAQLLAELESRRDTLFRGQERAWQWVHLIELWDYIAPVENYLGEETSSHDGETS